MELTEHGWIPAKKFNNCYAEIRDCLKKYNQSGLDAIADMCCLIEGWCRDMDNEEYYTKLIEEGKIRPLSAICSYVMMYYRQASDMIDEIMEEENQEQIRACIRKHMHEGEYIFDEECDECFCPDCMLWCELNARSAPFEKSADRPEDNSVTYGVGNSDQVPF